MYLIKRIILYVKLNMYLFVFIRELEGIVIFFKIWELVVFVCNDM